MDPARFFGASRLVIVAGKGGVGKTVVSATLARAAARAGLSHPGHRGRGQVAAWPRCSASSHLDYDEVTLVPGRRARRRGRGAGPHPDPRRRAARVPPATTGCAGSPSGWCRSGALDVVATAAPGIKDILVLGKVKQLERETAPADLIVVDAPAAGHAITFLQAARGLLDAVRVGPINAQAREVLELLTDPARCQVVLVTLPEETPVNELVETAFSLEDKVGVGLGPVVVNGLLPRRRPASTPTPRRPPRRPRPPCAPGRPTSLAAAAGFRRDRTALQVEQLARLADAAAPAAAAPALRVRRPRSARPSCDAPRRPRSLGARSPQLPRGRVSCRADPAGTSSTQRRILVCCGSGGVGKTTTAAALGHGGGPRRPAGRASSRSTRPSGWPTPSGSRA